MPNVETDRLSERNLAIWRTYITTGRNQTEVGEQYGLSQSQVSEIIRKVREGLDEGSREDWRTLAIQTLFELHNTTMELVRAPLPPAFHAGEILLDENEEPVRDASTRLSAVTAALRVLERGGRSLGTDEPDRVQTDSTVHYTINGVDPEALK